MLFADVTLAGTIVGTCFSVLGFGSSMLGDGYVKWLLVRVGSDVAWCFDSEGSQGLCRIWEPRCLVEADDCDDTFLVVVMMVMIVNGKNCVHRFGFIIILLVLTIHEGTQCTAKPTVCLLRNHKTRLEHRNCLFSNADMLLLHVIRRDTIPASHISPQGGRLAARITEQPRL